MSELRISVLRALKIEYDGKPLVGLTSHKAQALLVYLAVTARSHTRQELAGLLWTDVMESSARTSLRTALAQLRKSVGEHVQADRHRVSFNHESSHWIDAHVFEDACRRLQVGEIGGEDERQSVRKAVYLYGEEFLAGFLETDAALFEEWVLQQREHTRRLALDALQRLATDALEHNNPDTGIEDARRILELDPLREEAHRTLMQLYAQSDNTVAALRQYNECVRILDAELSVPPSADTTTLAEALKEDRWANGIDAGSLESAGQSQTEGSSRPEKADDSPHPDASIPHNLPAALTALVGRHNELAKLDELLASSDVRLVSIVGPGGMGKTRLALAAAETQLDAGRFSDGVFFVPLVSLTVPDQLVPAIARALDYPLESGGEAGRRSSLQQIQDFLSTKKLLLALDNLEHLLEGAGLIENILAAAPGVKALVTSRERANLQGGQLFPLQGLDYSVEQLTGNSAVQLFLECARRRQPDFQAGPADLRDIGRICRLVEGMPLAIELAAAWIDTLAPVDITRELERNLAFLAVDSRNVPERHRSMQSVFDATWQRLDTAQQRAFSWLSVFRGGFTRSAAEEIAGLSLPMLSVLVAKSLIQFRPAESRYEIHELMRQFGERKLAERPDDVGAAQDRHSVYYCRMLAQSTGDLKGEAQQATLAALSQEAGNLRAAWERVMAQSNVDLLARAMDALGYFYEWTGRYAEGLATFEATATALVGNETAAAGVLRARAVAWCSLFGDLTGERDVPRPRLQQDLELLDELEVSGGDVRFARAFVLRQMGRLLQSMNIVNAIDTLAQSLELLRESGDPWETGITLAWLGQAYRVAGYHDQAVASLRQALALLRQRRDQRAIAIVLENLAQSLRHQDKREEALHLVEESLAIRREINDRFGIASSLIMLSAAHMFLGHLRAGSTLPEEALTIFNELGYREGVCRAYRAVSARLMMLGEYSKASSAAAEAMALAEELGNDRWKGTCLYRWGMTVLALGDNARAHAMLHEAITYLERAGVSNELARAHDYRAYSAWKLGDLSTARRHLSSALRSALEHRVSLIIRGTLSTVALLLSQQQKERAVELNALVRQDPVVANSRLFQDLVGRHMIGVTASMSEEKAAAAEKRGRCLDLYETAAAILRELEQTVAEEDEFSATESGLP